jgi:hypothetical protein
VEKLRRFSTSWISLKGEHRELCRGRFEQELQAQAWKDKSEKEHLAISREIFKEENRRSGFAKETAKSRQPLDLRV